MKATRTLKFILSTLLFLGMQSYSQAALIAIVDSGSDLTHPDLAPKAWVNPADDASLGFPGDIHGWNFLNNSPTLVDLSQVNNFSADVYTYFDVQMRLIDGTESPSVNTDSYNSDIQWIKAKMKDKKFMAELDVFGDFAHGTNVAGIAAKDSPNAVIMGITVIGKPAPGQNATPAPRVKPTSTPGEKEIYKILDQMTGSTDVDPTSSDAKIGNFLNAKHAQVANCSFGNSLASVQSLVKLAEFLSFKWFSSKTQTDQYIDYMMNRIMKVESAELIDASPNTLFVIAAGNDSSDNDIVYSSPASIKRDNTIAVAATVGRLALANFSNYGATMVEVAAPGVGILSDSPGGKQVRMSGTSQATPFVTNIAGKILDANSALTPAQVKQIIVQTVDLKDFLKGKVSSGGIVNPDRALMAAQLSVNTDLATAIANASAAVADLASTAEFPEALDSSLIHATPLHSEFESH